MNDSGTGDVAGPVRYRGKYARALSERPGLRAKLVSVEKAQRVLADVTAAYERG